MATIHEEINAVVEQLSPFQQRRVLEYAQRLAEMQQLVASLPKSPLPPGTPGSALLKFKITMPVEAAKAMEQALAARDRHFTWIEGLSFEEW